MLNFIIATFLATHCWEKPQQVRALMDERAAGKAFVEFNCYIKEEKKNNNGQGGTD